MTNQREHENITSIEMELALKLSQIEGSFRFLDYMNNEKTIAGDDFPRNTTERSSVTTNLARIKEVRNLYKRLLVKHRIECHPDKSVDCSRGA